MNWKATLNITRVIRILLVVIFAIVIGVGIRYITEPSPALVTSPSPTATAPADLSAVSSAVQTCEQMQDSLKRDECYRVAVSQKKADITTCAKILDGHERDYCYSAAGACEKIGNLSEKEDCFKFSAVSKNIDPLIECLKLSDEAARDARVQKLLPPKYLGLSEEEIIIQKNQEIKSTLRSTAHIPEFFSVWETTSFDGLPPSGTVLNGENSTNIELNKLVQGVIENGGGPVTIVRSTGAKDPYFVMWTKLNGTPTAYYCVDFGFSPGGVELLAPPQPTATKCTESF